MSNAINSAATEARRMLKGFEGLSQVLAALDTVSNLEQAEREATQRLALLYERETVVKSALNAALAEADRVTLASTQRVEQAERTAAELEAVTKLQCKEALANAEVEAQAKISDALAQAWTLVIDAQTAGAEATAQAQTRLNELNDQIAKALARLQG